MGDIGQVNVSGKEAQDRVAYIATNRRQHQPLRILQVVSRMQRAGIETWLMHVLRHVDRERFQMDFLVHREEPGHFDDEIRALGSRVLFAAPLRRVCKYSQLVTHLLRSAPPYDIVHSHLDYFSGYPLKCADRVGVPIRIAHSHNDLARSYPRLRWSLKLYAQRSMSLISRHCTLGLATSAVAGESLFGRQQSSFHWSVLPCGIDLSVYAPEKTRGDIRSEFGIPDDAIVVGHVGRFAEQKNHDMILNIAEAMLRRTSKFHLVLVGEGPLRERTEEEVNRRGLATHVTFAGVRGDVPRLLASAFDVFLFPSLFEGLGLVVVEAQSAGCPVVISDVVPHEADVVSRLITRLPLSSPTEQWAEAILQSSLKSRSYDARVAAYTAIGNSPFNISVSVRNLTSLYSREFLNCKAA